MDAIASHGQTLSHWHSHGDQNSSKKEQSYTLQVGSPSIIAELTGILTIGNFRYRDLAASGKGAPLVAYANWLRFGKKISGTQAFNNLGSISNLTAFQSGSDAVLAFDTGPANLIIDWIAQTCSHNSIRYDKDGASAAQGKIIPKFFDDLAIAPFYFQAPPKAAGYQDFLGEAFQKSFSLHRHLKMEDLLRTAVEITAHTLVRAYQDFVFPKFGVPKEIVFSGGGTRNVFLMARIQQLFCEIASSLKVTCLSASESEAEEPLAFAVIAHETLCGRCGSIPSTTGAQKPVVLGEIAL